MLNSLYSDSYRAVIKLLIAERKRAGFTQVQVAEKLGVYQSAISKIERLERRADIVEVFEICKAMGISRTEFAKRVKEVIDNTEKSRTM